MPTLPVDTPTTKVMGFLLPQPLHCHRALDLHSLHKRILYCSAVPQPTVFIFRRQKAPFLRYLPQRFCLVGEWCGTPGIPISGRQDFSLTGFYTRSSCTSGCLDTSSVLLSQMSRTTLPCIQALRRTSTTKRLRWILRACGF